MLQFVTDMAKESENVTLDHALVTKGVHVVLHDASKGFYILGEARVWDMGICCARVVDMTPLRCAARWPARHVAHDHLRVV